MSQVNALRSFVNERLAAAAEEIFRMVEKTFTEHHVEVSRLCKELDYQRKLVDIALKPEIKLHRTDYQKQSFIPSEKEVPLEPQQCELECSFSSVKEEPEPPHLKEEQLEVVISSAGMQPYTAGVQHQGLEAPVELGQNPLSNVLQSTLENGEGESLPCTPANQITDLPCILNSMVLSQTKSYGQSENASHACKVCKKSCQYKDNLVRYARLQTEDSKCCGACGEFFIGNSELKLHKQSHKSLQCKVHCCEICGKKFSKVGSLSVHMKSHTEVKPLSCHVCNKRFVSRRNLARHVRTHIGEKLYSCNDCNKRFTKCIDLKKHRWTHKEKLYCCHMCGKEVCTSEDLKKHMVIHIGEKPYSCEVCGKGVSSSTNLEKHMKIHIGV